ncbi:hypothetical protein Acid345_1780 [Candidatus Koribacter versatilis Ellin345]|uniref:Uncharacterized protein n=1 Tax=Koribacter versatilis (strain Ellin345) TaxID=204669 RepID=Q1IQR9_KORVE|nr:hypothetical protein [Candidatus Koribacter versatilis]ABF40781.1 hypothetical protein Acid345_1780 [Candidatus Koribacter versatilis Ellin345]
MTSASPQSEPRTATSEWRTARRLYAIYSNVIAHFDVGVPPCPDLECPIDRPDFGSRGRIRNWLNLMDNHCPVTFLRQVLQRDPIGTEANMRALILRHLDRPHKTEFDRDKLDFLLVQYFAHCVPDDLSPGELTIAEVGRVLEPVLGHWSPVTPYWLKPLEDLAEDVAKCHCMADLDEFKILERGRDVKTVVGNRFFEPPALIAFTRYNIILRRAFFYTMRADLEMIRVNLVRLQKHGVKSIDGTRAGLSEREALSSVQRICQEWRSIFRTDYSAGHVFRSIKELRACTDGALAEIKRKHEEEQAKEGRRKAKESAEQDSEAVSLGIQLEVDLSDNVTDEELNRALSVFEHEADPENTVERAYPELTVDADPIAGTPARYKIPDVIGRIHAQIVKAQEGAAKPLSVRLDNSAIRLASWEVKAFSVEEDDPVTAIRRSVAARLILQEAFDDFQDGFTADLRVALTIAHAEAGRMQERIAEARDARDLDLIVFLAATGQRMLELMHEAQFAWNEEMR